MKIGYQGMVGSNSEEAAHIIARKLGFQDVEFIPLINSRAVIGELKRKNIDYAVLAIKNSLGGTVIETFEAIKHEYLELVGTEILQIHHCLFKAKKAKLEDITTIASHRQALKQTKQNRERMLPGCTEQELEDTALSAKYLAEGQLGHSTAILCKKSTGESYGLDLVYENIEDSINNFTEFRMFKLSDIDYTNTEKPTISEKLKYQIVNETGIGYVSKTLMILAIFASFYISKFFEWSRWDTAVFVGGYLSALFLFLTSKRLKEKYRYQSLIGYWKYYSFPDQSENNPLDQKIETPRLVKIDEIDGNLIFSGFICDNENIPFFESTNILISMLGKSRGQLVYWYNSPQEMNRGYSINGIVELNWTSKFPEAKINKMSGYFMGKTTKMTGGIEYLRISEEEYQVHKNSDFL